MKRDRLTNHTLLNLLHTVLLFGGMAGLLGALGLSLAGVRGLLWAVGLAVPLLLIGQRVSPQLVLRLYGARPLGEREAPGLYEVVRQLADRASLSHVPRIAYIPSRLMNALSFGDGEDAVLGVTDGLLHEMSARELTGVLAHEIAHIRRNDTRVMSYADLISRATRLLSIVGQVLLFLNLPLLLFGVAPVSWLAVVLLLIAPTLSGLLQLALAREREFDADLGAARLTADPMGLASALHKMGRYEARLMQRLLLPGRRPADSSLLRSHPDTEERIRRLLELIDDQGPPVLGESATQPVQVVTPSARNEGSRRHMLWN